MKIFYDGLDIEKYAQYPVVEGFTTNCMFFSQRSVVRQEAQNYKDFYNNCEELLLSRSISFQIWEHGSLGIEQIDAIHAINKNIYVTIPIINMNDDINEDLIAHAVLNNMRINVTAIYTYAQMNITYQSLKKTTNDAIVSVFAGGISDSGVDPSLFILHAKRLFKDMPNVQILWAGCRELYTIKRAEELECDIIAVPGDILDKLQLFNTDLNQMSFDLVNDLRTDAIRGGISIHW
jgi:transaldolase